MITVRVAHCIAKMAARDDRGCKDAEGGELTSAMACCDRECKPLKVAFLD